MPANILSNAQLLYNNSQVLCFIRTAGLKKKYFSSGTGQAVGLSHSPVDDTVIYLILLETPAFIHKENRFNPKINYAVDKF